MPARMSQAHHAIRSLAEAGDSPPQTYRVQGYCLREVRN
jgi:hypothetical protein